jgi:ABC-type nitrate/sulfonate/bicarbonate transport system substrate-binding protein
MSKISATLVCLCFSLISWADARAAAAKPKVVIAHAAMNFRVAPLWVAQDQGFFAKYGIDPEVIFMRGGPTLFSGMLSGDIQIGWTASAIIAPILAPSKWPWTRSDNHLRQCNDGRRPHGGDAPVTARLVDWITWILL